MSTQSPKPRTTAAIILGAAEFPSAPQFEAAPQFANSASAMRAFLLAEGGFGLSQNNLLDLFDIADEQPVIIRKIATFLLELRKRIESTGESLSDIIFFYVGHGGFDTAANSTYFLAIRQTNAVDYLASSVAISSLRRALRESTRDARHYLILDCCFAAAAVAPYLSMSATAQAMVTQVQDAFPPSGTALLCASGAIVPARAKRDAQFTMFSEALIDVLRQGVTTAPEVLTLSEIGTAVRGLLKTKYGDEAVRPEVHSPEQSQGSVADIPLFRNARMKENTKAPPPLPEGVLSGKTRSNDEVEIKTTLDGLFKEFDDSDIPAQIPGYPLTENEWATIPREVRAMLKALEGLEYPIIGRISKIVAATSLTASVFLLVVLIMFRLGGSSPFYERFMLPSAIAALIVATICMAYLLWLIMYRAVILIVGERIRDRIIIRARTSATLPWEGYAAINLLRRPRDIVKFRARAFLKTQIQSELVLAIIVLMSAVVVFVIIFFLGKG
jgi:hypothetical protein